MAQNLTHHIISDAASTIATGRRLFGRGPAYLIYFVTSRCNASCAVCCDKSQREPTEGPGAPPELSTEEIEKTVPAFSRILQLTLTGGEPFLRDDLPDIATLFSRAARLKSITIPTNGLLPDRIEKMTDRIAGDMPGVHINLNVSIDAIGVEHDTIRGVEGAFENATETLIRVRRLVARRPNLSVNTATMMRAGDEGGVKDTMREIARSFSPDRQLLILERDRPSEKMPIDTEAYATAAEEALLLGAVSRGAARFHRVYRSAERLVYKDIARYLASGKYPFKCVAGNKLLVMRADGTIYPCELLHTKLAPSENILLGGLREHDYKLAPILSSPGARRILEKIKKSGCGCTYECALIAGRMCKPVSLLPVIARAMVPTRS